MRHFLSSCSRILGADTTAATVSVGALNAKLCVLPYGPSQKDIKWLYELLLCLYIYFHIFASRRPLADSNRSSFNTTGLKTIFAKESYDHLPGVMHKILAFEKFLCLYPEWADKVSITLDIIQAFLISLVGFIDPNHSRHEARRQQIRN